MKKIMMLVLGLSLALGGAAFAADEKPADTKPAAGEKKPAKKKAKKAEKEGEATPAAPAAPAK